VPAFVFLFTQEPAEAEGTAEVPHDGQAFPGNGKVERQVVLYIVPEVFSFVRCVGVFMPAGKECVAYAGNKQASRVFADVVPVRGDACLFFSVEHP